MYGVTKAELEIAQRELDSYFKSQAQKSHNRESVALARQLVWSVNDDRVFQSPEQERELFVPVIESFEIADINAAFSRILGREERLVEVMGNVLIESDNPEKHILDVYRQAQGQTVDPYVEAKKENFPYDEMGQAPVEPVRFMEHPEIGVKSYIYGNGVVLNLKKTDFKKNEVEIIVEFGPGQQHEPQPGMAMIAESVVFDSGSGRMTASAIEDALAGSSIDYEFEIEDTRFTLTGNSLSEEAELLVRTLHTLFIDPGVRAEAFSNTMVRYEQMYESLKSDIRGAESLYVKPFIAGGNSLFGLPRWEEVAKIELSQIGEWIMPIFKESAPQISVVGDFDGDKIVRLVNTYFGAMPHGKIYHPEEERIDFPAGEKLQIALPTQLDKSLVVFSWKTEGFRDISVVRRLGMLAAVLDERIRLSVREKLGVAYSPTVYNSSSRFAPDFGFIYARLIVDAKNIAEVQNALVEIAEDLQRNGVKEEELARVRKPLLTYLKDRLQNNSYWLNTVLYQSAIYPEQLQWPTTIVEDNASITAEEISSYARKYLQPDKAAISVIRPE